MDPVERWPAYYRVVREVPRGRVTTYGQVALLAGAPGYARHVGRALAALRGTRHRIPWQRVLAKEGRRARIALLDPAGAAVQRALLEREGVAVDARGRVSLAEYGWPPPVRPSTPAGGAGLRSGRADRVSRPPAPASRPRSPGRTRGSSGRS